MPWPRLSEVRLCGQKPEHDLLLGCTGLPGHGRRGGQGARPRNGQVRHSRAAPTCSTSAGLVHALDNIHFYLRPGVARDCTVEPLDMNTVLRPLGQHRKHVMGNAFTPQGAPKCCDVAALIAGGAEALRERRRLFRGPTAGPSARCAYAPETVETAGRDRPARHAGGHLVGARRPGHLAGYPGRHAGADHRRELSGLTYINLLRPGTRVMHGLCAVGGRPAQRQLLRRRIEFALMNAAGAQIAQYYGLPVYNSRRSPTASCPMCRPAMRRASAR